MALQRTVLTAVTVFSTLLFGCDRSPDGMDIEYDPEPVVGCYRSSTFPDDIIRLNPKSILLNKRTIYARYEYGLDGRARSPMIYAYPQAFFWSDGGHLNFSISEVGSGTTLIPERIDGRRAFRLPVFPSSNVSEIAEVQLFEFIEHPCLIEANLLDS